MVFFLPALLFIGISLNAQTSNVLLRVMASNLSSGNNQRYESPGLDILQGLKPDVVAMQEFNVSNSFGINTTLALSNMVATTFGTNFSYFRETGYSIPNGIISRYPIVTNGSWLDNDTGVNDRGFAWARIDLPGTNDLYVVSVHLKASNSSGPPSDASRRAGEAAELKDLITTNFPANAWIVVAGDMNLYSDSETAITTFTTFLSDSPVPADQNGDVDTNSGRSERYDRLLPSFSMTNRLISVVLPSHTFPNGLVFDSRVYTPLSDVPPVVSGDSGALNMQHMGVVKDFQITFAVTNGSSAPVITTQPQSQTNAVGTLAHFAVGATGTAPLSHQWRFNGTNITNATGVAYDIASVQATNAGGYSVVITNVAGSVTSTVAQLVIATGPQITVQPQALVVVVGADATFDVSATGTAPLSYQWRFGSTTIAGATGSSYTRTNAQISDAGNYTVVVTNTSGSVTSAVALLSVIAGSSNIVAQWNFNSATPDSTNQTGTLLPALGLGSASYVGGTAPSATGFATGSTTDTNANDNSGWNTTTYPAVTSANLTAGVRFDVSTVGRQNIVIRWDQRVSNTGSKYSRLQYTTNGTDFWSFPTANAVVAPAAFEPRTNSLSSLPGVNNNTNFAFRILSEFEFTATGAGTNAYVGASGNYGIGGTVRFDMVTVLGDLLAAANPPPAAAVLSGFSIGGNQFQMLVTGSTGTNYVVQSATNLAAPAWISLFTNASPFLFSDTNTLTFPVKFYRAVWQP